MTGMTPNYQIRYPQPTDLIKDPNVSSKLANDMRDGFLDTDAAIAGIDEKYKSLPQRMGKVEETNTDQEFRLNVEASSTRRLEYSTPLSTPEGFHIRDSNGTSAFGVDGQGNTTVGDTRIEPIPDGAGVAFRIRDKTGAVALSVTADGFISLPGSGAGFSEVHLIIGAGQSNMSGRGTPIGAEYDPVDPRIFQFGSGASNITQATVPLDMHDIPTGLSPLTTFAREYARTVPATVAILLVPAAHGGTGFTTPAPLSWDSAVTGGLYDDMVAQTLASVTAARNLWGIQPKIKAMLWHQGEADGTLTTAQYASRIDALIAKVRVDLKIPGLPIIIGQMSSDWVAQNAGPLRVQAAHIDTPARVENTAFAPSPPDTGREADLVHFGRSGVESIGSAMLKALPIALANKAGVLVMPPTGLRAYKSGGAVTAYWDAPLCRAAGYGVEYRVNAGAWIAVTGREIVAHRQQDLPADATEVRVSTISPAGNSRFTQPVPVQGA